MRAFILLNAALTASAFIIAPAPARPATARHVVMSEGAQSKVLKGGAMSELLKKLEDPSVMALTTGDGSPTYAASKGEAAAQPAAAAPAPEEEEK